MEDARKSRLLAAFRKHYKDPAQTVQLDILFMEEDV